MGFVKEFKEFALKGNVVDLAVAVIIGAAFSAIIGSFVVDIITPLLLKPVLEQAGITKIEELGWGAVKYGKFLAAVINFIIIALVLFLMIKGINKVNKKKEEPVVPAGPTNEEKLLMEIRDALRK